jgi:hypothetical protein
MIAYIYDENTKEFLYEVQVEESPLEAGVILMPPNATLEPIGEDKENFAQKLADALKKADISWQVLPLEIDRKGAHII